MLLAVKISLAFVILLVGLTLFLSERRVAAANAKYPPLGEIVDINGKSIHALVMGEGPDLVLIHGVSGNMRDFTLSIAPELAKSYRVFLFDRPGLGHTASFDRSGESLKEQALLLREAALAMGAKRPIVLGQSYGGAVALAWAIHAPKDVSALVLVAAASHPWETPLPLYYKVTSHPLFGFISARLISAFATERQIQKTLGEVFDPLPIPDGYREGFGVELILRPNSIVANAKQRANIKAEILSQYQSYKTLTLPIEVVHSVDDVTVPFDIHAKRLQQDIARLNLTALERAGHMPHHTAPTQVIEAVHRVALRRGLNTE